MNGRVEAAARALWEGLRPDNTQEDDAYVALAAADRFDAAHGIVRVRVDDALTEKIAEVIHMEFCVECRSECDETAAVVVAALQEGAEKP